MFRLPPEMAITTLLIVEQYICALTLAVFVLNSLEDCWLLSNKFEDCVFLFSEGSALSSLDCGFAVS